MFHCWCTETIVGVNKYRLDKQEKVEVLEIDNSKVREQQIARINKIRKSRDNVKVSIKQHCLLSHQGIAPSLEFSVTKHGKIPRISHPRYEKFTMLSLLMTLNDL